jgi:hypothetical protein
MTVVNQIPMPRPREKQVSVIEFEKLQERVKVLEELLMSDEKPKRGRQPKADTPE